MAATTGPISNGLLKVTGGVKAISSFVGRSPRPLNGNRGFASLDSCPYSGSSLNAIHTVGGTGSLGRHHLQIAFPIIVANAAAWARISPMNTGLGIFATWRALKFLFIGPLVLALLCVINLMTSPGDWWVQWPALGIGIAWVISRIPRPQSRRNRRRHHRIGETLSALSRGFCFAAAMEAKWGSVPLVMPTHGQASALKSLPHSAICECHLARRTTKAAGWRGFLEAPSVSTKRQSQR